MKVSIVYHSSTGNTKKVVDLVKEKLTSLDHDVLVRHALTATPEVIEDTDMVLIGTPVHGYILFGQKPAKEVSEFLKKRLPDDLGGKPVLGFATFLFFPSGALKPIRRAVESRNGEIVSLPAKRRTRKKELADQIVLDVKKWSSP